MSNLVYKEFYRRNLPHIQPPGATFFVTYRLVNTLPKSITQQLAAEKKQLEAIRNSIPDSTFAKRQLEMRRKWFVKIEQYLDSNDCGPTWLNNPKIAKLVVDSFHHLDKISYELIAYCVMSNHVHVIFTPLIKEEQVENLSHREYHSLSSILHSLKRHTAAEANKILGREGQFWHHESFDHYIRNEEELEKTIAYTLNNPVKAGLVKNQTEWKWSYHCNTSFQLVASSTNWKLVLHTVNYFSTPPNYSQFESAYISLRQSEGRIYTDGVLKKLPNIAASHPLLEEWQIRQHSLKKLIQFLAKNKQPLSILDLGCGNGWMSAQFAGIPNSTVWGVDLNATELKQAARVFNENKNLYFIYGDIFEETFPLESFDAIILASSIQYFEDVNRLINRLLALLKSNGKIHIIDSPFYDSHSIPGAKLRTKDYYQGKGFPEMTDHYYHHTMYDLNTFQPQILYNPDKFSNRLRQKLFREHRSPFPWIMISKGAECD